MKLTIKKEIEVEPKFLLVKAGVRYWEDTKVNGIDDFEDGTLIPCKEGDVWCPIIDIEIGQIINWTQGVEADVHYKVCDAGEYILCDHKMNTLLIKDGYVPKIMCPKENGFGDYIIMDIDESGMIADWKVTFDGFQEEED